MPGKKSAASQQVHERRMHLEEKLIENLVELQKVHTNLAEKFDRLADQISSLLGLFEGAAQSFARNPVNKISEKDQEFLEKIDKLLEQNKTIARSLTMMEERTRERIASLTEKPEQKQEEMSSELEQPSNRPLPRF